MTNPGNVDEPTCGDRVLVTDQRGRMVPGTVLAPVSGETPRRYAVCVRRATGPGGIEEYVVRGAQEMRPVDEEHLVVVRCLAIDGSVRT